MYKTVIFPDFIGEIGHCSKSLDFKEALVGVILGRIDGDDIFVLRQG